MVHIHHVQVRVQNGIKYLQKFVRNANFQLFATRRTTNLRQWAVRSGSIVFLITDTTEVDRPGPANKSPEPSESGPRVASDRGRTTVATSEPVLSLALPDQCFLEHAQVSGPEGSQQARRRDTVFNIAFEVGNVSDALTRAERNGARVLCRPMVVSGAGNDGQVTIAAVQSCVGNVVHTLIDRTKFSGTFLPGFVAADDFCEDLGSGGPTMDCNSTENGKPPAFLTNHIDHVTFVCPMGSSSQVLDWYEKCFGMKRFLLMREESESDGFIVQGKNVGLRMKVMEYWHCAETGLALPAPQQKGEDADKPSPPRAKFVIAEALPGHGPNQVETFLEQHGGAGIQHIGLHTHDIIQAVSTLRQSGLSFIDPPSAYYTQVGKLTEISGIRDDVELLQRMGILLDEEAGSEGDADGKSKEGGLHCGGDSKAQCKYLMQVFTKPIFEQDTFFLELIQRQGATGFGAGNIRALWRAVQSYMSYEES